MKIHDISTSTILPSTNIWKDPELDLSDNDNFMEYFFEARELGITKVLK